MPKIEDDISDSKKSLKYTEKKVVYKVIEVGGNKFKVNDLTGDIYDYDEFMKDNKIIIGRLVGKKIEYLKPFEKIKCPNTSKVYILDKETSMIYDYNLFMKKGNLIKNNKKNIVAKLIKGKIAMKKVKDK